MEVHLAGYQSCGGSNAPSPSGAPSIGTIPWLGRMVHVRRGREQCSRPLVLHHMPIAGQFTGMISLIAFSSSLQPLCFQDCVLFRDRSKTAYRPASGRVVCSGPHSIPSLQLATPFEYPTFNLARSGLYHTK